MSKARKLNYNKLTIDQLIFRKLGHWGHNVSHAKNRTNRAFNRNLHRVTVILQGVKHKVEVPTKVLRMLKKHKLTTHFQPVSK